MSHQILFLIILLGLSGFFSSAETAFFSISGTRARHMAKQGGRAQYLILRMKKDPHRLLTTILIGNNIVNVGAAALATSVAIQAFSNYAVGLSTGIMTFLIVVFGEVMPKSFATRNNLLIAGLAIYPIYWLSILFYPIIQFLKFIPRITGKMKRTPGVTEQELLTFVEVVEEAGKIKQEEKELIKNIFDFDDTNASEIMTPRGDMFVVDVRQEIDLEKILRSGYTRIPVIEGDLDEVVGILNIKDLFLQVAVSPNDIDIRGIMKKPLFVPEFKKLDSLVRKFKNIESHMAIVVDEHGGVSGLITLEDALEQLVGEITDETDRAEALIVRIDRNEWTVAGKSKIDDVNETIGISIPESAEYDTFSGYILNLTGRIPEEKERIPIGRFLITVSKKTGNRIREFHVNKITSVKIQPEKE